VRKALVALGAVTFIGYAMTLPEPPNTPVSALAPPTQGNVFEPPASERIASILDKYNRGAQPTFATLTADQKDRVLVALDAAYKAGFRGSELVTIVSIAGRESNWNPSSHGVSERTKDNSYGLWQINMRGSAGPRWAKMFGISSYSDLLNPYVNARAAMVMCKAMISYGKTCFHGWGPYKGNPPLGTAAKYVRDVYHLAVENGYFGSNPASPTVLFAGATGDEVAKLQQQLNDVDDKVCGSNRKCLRKYRVGVDGVFGNDTKQAVIMFQRDQGLECDGMVGPATRRALADPTPGWKGCA
jgi:hypothetical protein